MVDSKRANAAQTLMLAVEEVRPFLIEISQTDLDDLSHRLAAPAGRANFQALAEPGSSGRLPERAG